MDMMKFLLFIFLITIHGKFSSASSLKPELAPSIKKLLKDSELTEEQVSFHIEEIKSDAIIESHNSNVEFTPASVTKILTSYYALKHLPLNESFDTELYLDVKSQSSGSYKGDLYIVGKGNPYLGTQDLFEMAISLKLMGIKKLNGNIYFDDYYFPTIQVINVLGEHDHTYNSTISPLSINFNRFNIWREGDSSGRKGNFFTIPPVKTLKISKSNGPFPVGTKFLNKSTGPDIEEWSLSKLQKYHQKEKLPLRNPALTTASLLEYFLNLTGVETDVKILRKDHTDQGELISTKNAPNNKQMLKWTLEFSNNLFAETLLFQTNLIRNKKAHDLIDASRHMIEWFKLRMKKTSFEKVKIINGSGLTSENKMSAKFIVDVLKLAERDIEMKQKLWPLLTVSGATGWFKKRLDDHELTYKVWAKTGNLDYVSAISGYLISKSNKHYAFSILTQDDKKRKILDIENNLKTERLKKLAYKWKSESFDLQNAIIRHWYYSY